MYVYTFTLAEGRPLKKQFVSNNFIIRFYAEISCLEGIIKMWICMHIYVCMYVCFMIVS